MVRQLHVSDSGEPFLKKKIETVKNKIGWNKPKDGFWTSTLIDDETSDWLNWSVNEGYYPNQTIKLWSLEVQDNAVVLVIDNKDDYENALALYERVEVDSNYQLRSFLDFEKISKDFHGLQVTKNGLAENRTELYRWDVESTVWFDWCFTDVTYVSDIFVPEVKIELPF